MNDLENTIHEYLSTQMNNKLGIFSKDRSIEEIEKVIITIEKLLTLKSKSTEELKELCKDSKRKDIVEIRNKESLTENEQVYLAIYIVTHNLY